MGSLAGPLCSGGGFCAGTLDIIEHQRISSAAYTFSAALPAIAATTTSEAISILQENPDMFVQLRENIKTLRAQLDPRSDWVKCTSSELNPVQLLVLKSDVNSSKSIDREEQESIMQDVVDEVRLSFRFRKIVFANVYRSQCLTNGVLVTRLKSMPMALGVSSKEQGWQPPPALKVCATIGLSRKEMEKAGVVIRHAFTKVISKRTR